MKILVINGYVKGKSASEKFSIFSNAVKEAVNTLTAIGYSVPSIVRTDLNGIEDYLYERNSLYTKDEAKKIRRLFKLCKKTNKCLFAAGFGLSLLTYYCATNCAELNVINGKERGGPLEDLQNIPFSQATKFSIGDVFLDYTTGDYYGFKTDNKEWRAEGNVSLHYTKKASLTAPIASFLRTTKTYKPKTLPELYQIYRSRKDETICTTRKQYLHHWLFEDLPSEFLVLNDNGWDVHPVNLTHVRSVKRNYTVLSDCDRGPEIIEHLNTIAMQCNVSKRYPETIKILKNFVKHKLLEMFAQGRQDILVDVAVKEDTEIGQQIPQEGDHKNFNLGKGAIKPFTTNFAYSGLNYSKRRGVVVVANNAIASRPLKPIIERSGGLGTQNTSSMHSRTSLPLNTSESSRTTLLKKSPETKKYKPNFDPEIQYKKNLLEFLIKSDFEPNMASKFLHPQLKNEVFFQSNNTEREKRILQKHLERELGKLESPRRTKKRGFTSPRCSSQPSLRSQSPYISQFEQRLKDEKVIITMRTKIERKREVDRQKRIRSGNFPEK